MHFISHTQEMSLHTALDAGREVLMFDSFHEFTTFAGKISQPG